MRSIRIVQIENLFLILLLVLHCVACADRVEAPKWESLSTDIQLNPDDRTLTLGRIREILGHRGYTHQDSVNQSTQWIDFPRRSGLSEGPAAVRLGFYPLSSEYQPREDSCPQEVIILEPFKGSIHGIHVGSLHEDVVELAQSRLHGDLSQIKHDIRKGNNVGSQFRWSDYDHWWFKWYESEGKVIEVSMSFWNPDWHLVPASTQPSVRTTSQRA